LDVFRLGVLSLRFFQLRVLPSWRGASPPVVTAIGGMHPDVVGLEKHRANSLPRTGSFEACRFTFELAVVTIFFFTAID